MRPILKVMIQLVYTTYPYKQNKDYHLFFGRSKKEELILQSLPDEYIAEITQLHQRKIRIQQLTKIVFPTT